MKSFLHFLRGRPLLWLTPIVVFFGALTWLAWMAARTPSNPFAYSSF